MNVKRKESTFVLALALVMVAVLALVSLPLESGPVASVSSQGPPPSSTPCSSRIPDDPLPSLANESALNNDHILGNGSTRLLVFVMRPNTKATFCVGVQWEGTVTLNQLAAEAVKTDVRVGAYTYSRAPGINITSDVSQANLTANGGVAVTYAIATGKNASGLYALIWPGSCGGIPFAVTSLPLQDVSSAFPWSFPPFACGEGFQFALSEVDSYSGMTAVWLTVPPGY